MKNFYELLGVNSNANDEEIKSAYKAKAKDYHPDKNKGSKASDEMFKMINEAKDTLLDPMKRLSYDYKIGVKTTTLFSKNNAIANQSNAKKIVAVGLLAFLGGLFLGSFRSNK
ncbi:DnaJ domain-containing protein [Winogradskyella sp.]|uniref:J domain-containing protein n=1 Tax=Winogradskyella sp. TaxID=1883156 RepID=UPI002624B69F|nr:DnaJ domain-containing protein [Winogradskyella sp.]